MFYTQIGMNSSFRDASWLRITLWTFFLIVSILLGAIFRHLPELLELDEFRPNIIHALEQSFRCHAIVGRVTGELFPRPGFIVSRVVLTDVPSSTSRGRNLAAVDAAHFSMGFDFQHRRVKFTNVRFVKPRFFLYRETPRELRMLHLPGTGPAIGPANNRSNLPIQQLDVREGQIELHDHAGTVHRVWIADGFNGSFAVPEQTGVLAGQFPSIGRRALLQLHYRGNSEFPFDLAISNANLKDMEQLGGIHSIPLEGNTDFSLQARVFPSLKLKLSMEPVRISSATDTLVSGRMELDDEHVTAHLAAGTTSAMTLDLDGRFNPRHSVWKANVRHYNASLVHAFYKQTWVDRLSGTGSLVFSAEGKGKQDLRWSVDGTNFRLTEPGGKSLGIPEWTASGDTHHISVSAHGVSESGGTADATWNSPLPPAESTIEVDISSLTVGQVLDAFDVPHASPKAGSHPMTYESWKISGASLGGVIRPGVSFALEDSYLDVAGMHLDVSGLFDLAKKPVQAHLKGQASNVPVAQVVESFFSPPSPMTGTGQIDFALDFPLAANWISLLNGPCTVTVQNGVLRLLKTAYRIASVLNLGNYLRARLPKVSAEGIVFESFTGHLLFRNGLVESNDLFLKSPDMNVGAKGWVDIPNHRMDLIMRLELLRFLEDVLRDVPIIHWLFKKPNKILLPLVVRVMGPWDDVEIR